ncbi:MAG: amidohydrolase family protein, partial [Chloroflexota bacterium]
EEGVLVYAHAVDEGAAELAISNGVDGLVHWPGVNRVQPDELMQQLIHDQIPVITTFNFFIRTPEDVRRLLDAGGIIAMGSDAIGAFQQASLPFIEMNIMIEAGMTPMEVIIAATANSAEVVGLGDLVGTLEIGKMADIIVINGDPLTDFSVMPDVIIVIKGGEVIVSPE